MSASADFIINFDPVTIDFWHRGFLKDFCRGLMVARSIRLWEPPNFARRAIAASAWRGRNSFDSLMIKLLPQPTRVCFGQCRKRLWRPRPLALPITTEAVKAAMEA